MAAILQLILSNEGSNRQYTSIGSDNDLIPNEQQAIILTNDGFVHLRVHMSFGLDELNWDNMN